jgi:hypothetical protein
MPTLASARSLGGKHSSSEIKSKCDAAGGVYIGASKENGGHYGCDVNGGGMVYCSKNGKCDGSNPPKRVSGTDKRPLNEVLTTKPTTKGMAESKMEQLRHGQASHVMATSDPRKTPQGATTNQPTTTKGSQDERHRGGGARH